MSVRNETVTKCTYYATMGSVEMYEEGNSVKCHVDGSRITAPEVLREFATLLNDVAIKMEAKGGIVCAIPYEISGHGQCLTPCPYGMAYPSNPDSKHHVASSACSDCVFFTRDDARGHIVYCKHAPIEEKLDEA